MSSRSMIETRIKQITGIGWAAFLTAAVAGDDLTTKSPKGLPVVLFQQECPLKLNIDWKYVSSPSPDDYYRDRNYGPKHKPPHTVEAILTNHGGWAASVVKEVVCGLPEPIKTSVVKENVFAVVADKSGNKSLQGGAHGTYNVALKTIFILSEDNLGLLGEEALRSTTYHETGHFVSEFLGLPWDAGLNEAYKKDVDIYASHNPPNRVVQTILSYYLPRRVGGHHEHVADAFNEVTAELFDYFANQNSIILFKETFPNMFEYLREHYYGELFANAGRFRAKPDFEMLPP